MVTTELTNPRISMRRPLGPVRASVYCTLGLTLTTAAAAVLGALDPRLVSPTAPHPTIRPSLQAVTAILITNARVLALPILLVSFGFHRGRYARHLGDLAVTGVLAGNGVLVGLALGRWQQQLIPYLPHLPLEWAAAGIASSAWLVARTQTPDHRAGRGLLRTAAAALVVLVGAAAVEVMLTPHPARAEMPTRTSRRPATPPSRARFLHELGSARPPGAVGASPSTPGPPQGGPP